MGQQNGVVSPDSGQLGTGSDRTMDFDLRDVADVSISDIRLPESTKSQNGKHAYKIVGSY